MEWLTGLVGTAGAVAGGGVFGLFGSVLGQVSKYFQKKQEWQMQKDKWAYEKDMQKLQMEARAEETEQEIALVSQQGAWNGLDASIKAEMSTNGNTSQWVTDSKSLFRPVLTLLLWGLVALELYWMKEGILTTDGGTLYDTLTEYVVYSTVFSAATATAWWFGDRALSPPNMKHR